MAVQILVNRHFGFTVPTENSFSVKPVFWPYADRVICVFFVTLKTRVILPTTMKLDGDDIIFRMIVGATGETVHYGAEYFNSHGIHLLIK